MLVCMTATCSPLAGFSSWKPTVLSVYALCAVVPAVAGAVVDGEDEGRVERLTEGTSESPQPDRAAVSSRPAARTARRRMVFIMMYLPFPPRRAMGDYGLL